MRKLLNKILVLQEKRGIKGRLIRRINPWNPISYIVVLLATLLGLIMFGFSGIKDQFDGTNPFKWQ